MEGVPKQFSSPEEEIQYLRQQIASKEREMLQRTPEISPGEQESIAKQEIKEYVSFTPKMILDPEYEIKGKELAESVSIMETTGDPAEEIIRLAKEKGIRNALTVLEKTDDAYTIDEVHRRLIEYIKTGASVADLKEGVPPWHVLHMTLYEITMPALKDIHGTDIPFTDIAARMEQLFAGLQTIGSAKEGNHYAIEMAVADNSSDIIFYAAVPNEFTTLFEKQAQSLFPEAVLTVQPHDYNIYVPGGVTVCAEIGLKKHPVNPINTYDSFASDPFNVILNSLSRIDHSGSGAAVQFIVRHPRKQYRKGYEEIIKSVEKGTSPREAIARSSYVGDFIATVNETLFSAKKKETETEEISVDTVALEHFKHKLETPIAEVNIRVIASAKTEQQARKILTEIESTFNQFDTPDANQLAITNLKGAANQRIERAFSFRELTMRNLLPLSYRELASLIHFPSSGITATPQFKQSNAKTAAAPTEVPQDGTLLGTNAHQGVEKKIYVTEADRMRHFYVIGQTGTGKSVFLQNLIVQDIKSGAGVCMIDPHGSDIEEVLGAIPPERAQDVVYFDPSRLDRSIGLNMLEYDVNKSEQKTFIVNELLSIFQKLYGANPESMGPMFEQYFRNSTMLVMEHPESGNTLMDIGRVMADARFRRLKLQHATNPTVVQFWKEIASKAGGEASLENIVPYIVSKIDPLTANDYIRPIIGQQTSSFNFRQLMDERKILLVNLSKGRLGEINANLIGMIVVGKILMAALSRVDDPSKSFPPFYLHIDEFQNISTPAIASILSEARKYKLGLSIAHQFIAQLDQSIKDAVFGNVGSMAVFRVGNEDAQALESQVAPNFSTNDLMNTPNYHAVLRILANGVPTPAFSVATEPPPESDPSRVATLIEQSYAAYGRSRDEVEQEILNRYTPSKI